MNKNQKTLLAKLAGHLLMGSALGLLCAIVVMVGNIAHVADMISAAPDPELPMLKVMAVFGLNFGLGATITGFMFERTDRSA